MSIPLLRDPEKLHDLVDDLESLFWVLIYGTAKRFLQPGQRFDKDMFDQQTKDTKGRTVGGARKHTALLGGWLLKTRCTCTALQQLMFQCGKRWLEYHMYKQEWPPLDEKTKEELKGIPSLVSDPSFWMEKFASALRQTDALACCSHHAPSGGGPGAARPGTKRGAGDSAEIEAGELEQARRSFGRKRSADETVAEVPGIERPLRRSKRLKRSQT